MASKQNRKKSILWANELVRLVVPTAADVRWRSAHVARPGADRTVCGLRIRFWWFHCKEIQTAGELREKWVRETGNPNAHPHLHIQGTHLGASLDIMPSLCWNCFTLVTEGQRVQWAPKDYIDDLPWNEASDNLEWSHDTNGR